MDRRAQLVLWLVQIIFSASQDYMNHNTPQELPFTQLNEHYPLQYLHKNRVNYEGMNTLASSGLRSCHLAFYFQFLKSKVFYTFNMSSFLKSSTVNILFKPFVLVCLFYFHKLKHYHLQQVASSGKPSIIKENQQNVKDFCAIRRVIFILKQC